MNIEKVTISNFKNYDGEISFDLSKQITILHGDNGFGKSSFFDAIEWCLTNKIDRYDGTEGDIKRDIINKNCSLDNFQVSVYIEFGGNQLTRSFSVTNGEVGNTQVNVRGNNGEIHRGQAKVENFLKSQQFKDTNFGRGVYGQLIKQTYILSQDQVTEFVTSEDSAERYRALANIMGLKSMLNESDNVKKIYSALKAKDGVFESELKQYDESIKSKEEAKHAVDIYDMNLKLTQIGINDLQEDVEKQCKELQEQMVKEKHKNESFLRLYSELKLDQYEYIGKILDKITMKENKQKEHQIKVQKRKALLFKVQDRKKGINKEKQDLYKYNQIRYEISEKENKLLGLEIKETNLDEINLKLDLLRGSASKLEYQISIRQSLSLNLKQMKDLIEENKLFESKISVMINRKKRFQRLIKKLSHSLENNKNKIMVQLISNIKDIQGYVKVNNLEKCPVCSSVPEQKLEDCIEHNVVLLNEKIKEDTKYLEKLMKLMSKIEEKNQFFETEFNRMSSKIENNKLLLQRINEETNNYKSNVLYENELENYLEEELKNKLNKTRYNIKSLQEGMNILLTLKELYEQLNDVEKINTRKMQKEIEPRLEVDVNKLLVKFSEAETRIEKSISNCKLIIERMKTEIKTLERVVLRIKESISFEQYSQSLQEIFSIVSADSKELEIKISKLSNVNEMLVAMKINSEIENQIASIQKERSLKSKKKVELNKVIEVLSKHIKQKAEEFGNEAKDFLNKDNSSIQKYFRYLNPLPSNSLLRFEGDEEELSIKVVFDQDGPKSKLVSNAKNVLSSGQLNVLAISIFLAINEGQKTHTLDFVAIDDPIQNMDDVNQYSICDVLGHIKKQLIISTHDIEFLKLFIKKNEYRKENIQVYSFMSPYLNKDKVNHIHFT